MTTPIDTKEIRKQKPKDGSSDRDDLHDVLDAYDAQAEEISILKDIQRMTLEFKNKAEKQLSDLYRDGNPKALDSEREANSILTKQVDDLTAKLKLAEKILQEEFEIDDGLSRLIKIENALAALRGGKGEK